MRLIPFSMTYGTRQSPFGGAEAPSFGFTEAPPGNRAPAVVAGRADAEAVATGAADAAGAVDATVSVSATVSVPVSATVPVSVPVFATVPVPVPVPVTAPAPVTVPVPASAFEPDEAPPRAKNTATTASAATQPTAAPINTPLPPRLGASIGIAVGVAIGGAVTPETCDDGGGGALNGGPLCDAGPDGGVKAAAYAIGSTGIGDGGGVDKLSICFTRTARFESESPATLASHSLT